MTAQHFLVDFCGCKGYAKSEEVSRTSMEDAELECLAAVLMDHDVLTWLRKERSVQRVAAWQSGNGECSVVSIPSIAEHVRCL